MIVFFHGFLFVLHTFSLSLATPKILSLGNKNKSIFILYFSRLIVSLYPIIKSHVR